MPSQHVHSKILEIKYSNISTECSKLGLLIPRWRSQRSKRSYISFPVTNQAMPPFESPQPLTYNCLLDQVRALALTCLDILEKGFLRDAAIAGSTTFLKDGGVSFKIGENMEDRDFQAENCRELVIAVLGYMAYREVEWQQRRQRQREEQQEHDIRVLSPLRLNAILLEDNTKNYAALRRKFSDRAPIPETGMSSIWPNICTEETILWHSTHQYDGSVNELRVVVPASVCRRRQERLR